MHWFKGMRRNYFPQHTPQRDNPNRIALNSDLAVLFEWAHEGALFGLGLEATVTELGGGIDELEFDGFHGSSGRLLQEGLSEGDGSLLGATDATLDHDEIVLDQTVMDKATNWVDRFVGDVDLGGGIVAHLLAVNGVVTGTNAVDLLVDLGTMMVTLLTRSRDREGHTTWMPRSDTGDLSETLVSLSGQFLCVPSRSDTMVTTTLGDTDAVDHFSLRKDGVDSNILFEVGSAPFDLLGN